jgi:cytochrome b561
MFSAFRQAVKKFRFGSAKMSTAAAIDTSASDVYPAGMQIMHWAFATCVVGCVGTVNSLQFTNDKKLKGDLMFYHKSFGVLGALLLAPRLIVRATSYIPAHVPGAAWEKIAGAASHIALYGFMIAMPVTGVAMGYFGGKGLPFFYTTFDGAKEANGDIAKQAYKTHKFIGGYGQYLIPVHVGAVGYQFMFKGRNILTRMLGSAPK